MRSLFKYAALIFGLLICSQFSFSQTQKPLALEDYAQWNRIRSTTLSPNGNWMTYAYTPNEGDATLHIRKVDADTLRTVINGKQIAFSANSKWLAYLVDPTKEVSDKLKKSKKPVLSDLQIVNLESNTSTDVKNTMAFSFSKTSKFIAIHKNRNDKKADHKGSDLLLKNLQNNKTLNIGNVSTYAFNKEGTLFSYIVDADEDSGNGIYVIDLNNLRTWPLHTGAFTYAQMSWNKKGNQLAVLFGAKEEGMVERKNTIYWASNLVSGMTALGNEATYSSEDDASFPKNMVISEYSGLTWNAMGTQLFHGVKMQKEKLKKEDSLKANVDVWHWKDERMQSRQIVQAKRDLKSTFSAVLNIENKTFVPLANEDMPSVNTSEKSAWAVGRVDTLYRKDVNIPGGYADLYSINTKTGAKKLIAERVYRNMGMSPNGEWALFS